MAAIDVVEKKNDKIYTLFETYGKDTPNLEDLTRRLRANNKELKALEKQLVEIDEARAPEVRITEADIDDLAESLRYIIKTTENPKKLRHFFASFIEKIWVEEEQVRIEYKPECLAQRIDNGAVPSKREWLPGEDSNL